MYLHAQKRNMDTMRFQAALKGIDLDKEQKRNPKSGSDDLPRKGKGRFDGCIWGKPETYAHLSGDELKEWSDQLMQATSKTLGLVAPGENIKKSEQDQEYQE